MRTSQLALSRLWPLELGAGPGLVGVGGQSAIRRMCTFVRNICQSRRLRFVVNTRKRHTAQETAQPADTAHRNAQNSPDSGPRGAGGRAPGRCGPARRGAPGQASPGPPQRPRQMPRGQRHSAGRASSRLLERYVPTHDTPLRQSIFCAHTQCLTHGRAACGRHTALRQPRRLEITGISSHTQTTGLLSPKHHLP